MTTGQAGGMITPYKGLFTDTPLRKGCFCQILQHSSFHSPRRSRGLSDGVKMFLKYYLERAGVYDI